MQAQVTDSTLNIAFDGDILSSNIAQLREELLKELDQHAEVTALEVDVGRARIIDSQGLNLLIALAREAEKRNQAFRLRNPTSEIRRVLTLLNLSTRLGVV